MRIGRVKIARMTLHVGVSVALVPLPFVSFCHPNRRCLEQRRGRVLSRGPRWSAGIERAGAAVGFWYGVAVDYLCGLVCRHRSFVEAGFKSLAPCAGSVSLVTASRFEPPFEDPKSGGFAESSRRFDEIEE